MASFDDGALSTSAFSTSAFDFDSTPPTTTGGRRRRTHPGAWLTMMGLVAVIAGTFLNF
jgi:hypothetical protein